MIQAEKSIIPTKLNNENTGIRNMRKLVFLILSLAWMIVIFWYSSRNSELSTEDSQSVALTIGDITINDFDQWTTEAQYEYAASIDHPVRKAAHFSEYMLLGILLFGAWYDSDRKKSKNFLVPFIIGSLYAASDELHQLLISGRAGMFSDVLIDSSGVFAGVLLSMLSVILFVLFKSKRQKAHK